jgi:hypothetical protein
MVVSGILAIGFYLLGISEVAELRSLNVTLRSPTGV